VARSNERSISKNPKIMSQYDLLKRINSGDFKLIEEIKNRLGSSENLKGQSR
jgi:hypothetical protein